MKVSEFYHSVDPENLRWLKYLLKQFSPEIKSKVIAGDLDQLILETIESPQTIVCIASGDTSYGAAALYLATVEPIFFERVLIINLLVIDISFRDSTTIEKDLSSHMEALAAANDCSRVVQAEMLLGSKTGCQRV